MGSIQLEKPIEEIQTHASCECDEYVATEKTQQVAIEKEGLSHHQVGVHEGSVLHENHLKECNSCEAGKLNSATEKKKKEKVKEKKEKKEACKESHEKGKKEVCKESHEKGKKEVCKETHVSSHDISSYADCKPIKDDHKIKEEKKKDKKKEKKSKSK